MSTSQNVIPFQEAPAARNSPPVAARTAEFRFTHNPAMQELYKQIDRIAQVDVPVLLLGESGVGKEFVARALHARSLRSQSTFLKVNCAALPSELLESELFGYEPGAFTGAVRSKPGQFELCDHGTILLDEIGEMTSPLQAKLLQVLQDQQFSRLGGRRMLTVDVRILAATNIDIDKALEEKIFRPDLYYRLNTITLRIPALRERREDIPLFLDYFLEELSEQLGCPWRTFSKRIMDACLRYSWPGNVRELKNFVCRYLVLADDEAAIEALRGVQAADAPASKRGMKQLVHSIRAEAETRMIEECLAKSRWNRTEAARALHISTKTLWNKMRQYDIRDSSREGGVFNDKAARVLPKLAAGAPHSTGQDGKPDEPCGIERMGPVSPRKVASRGACAARAAAD